MTEQSSDSRLHESTTSPSLTEAILSGEYDHLNKPIQVLTRRVEDGIEYGHTLFGYSITPKRREEYIRFLGEASPPVTTRAINKFRKLAAEYHSTGTERLEMEDHCDELQPDGVMDLVEEHIVITFVDEVLTHRPVYRECEEIILRHLQTMHRVASDAEKVKGELQAFFSSVIDLCFRTAQSFEAETDGYQDQCCALLYTIHTMRNSSFDPDNTAPAFFSLNHVFDILCREAIAVCSLGLACSGLSASRLLFETARLHFWWLNVENFELHMKDIAPVHKAIAECGRQAGLCYGRAYQWAMVNTSHWFAFVEWCQITPRCQVIQRLERLSEIDGHHLDCVSRCEHGKSISAGQAGHMPWCRSHKRPMVSTRRRCAEFVITISEQDGSKVLVFDTVHQRLRYLEDREAYVAVSHVWGQRLFGQETRTLGQCALSELKRLATYKGVECVWLDSLCVPGSPEARRRCIDGMGSIYQDATCVAVYDEGIMIADGENELGFAFEVSISEWNSRVWTLQEGLLNKKVMYAQEKNYISNKAERVHSFLRWYRAYAVTGILSHIAAGKMEMEPVDIFSLAAGRTTSHEVDYVCGLGALLPKPIARIGIDLNSAAVAMAKVLDVIDIGLLCTLCPRASADGYGWMPLGVKDMMPIWRTGVLGTVFDDGLHVEAYSLHITRLSQNEDLLQIGGTKYRYTYAEGSIRFFTHTMVDLSMQYDFICGMYDEIRATGFFVALGDNEVVQYVTPVEAVTVDEEICPSKNFYIIGGAPFLPKFAY